MNLFRALSDELVFLFKLPVVFFKIAPGLVESRAKLSFTTPLFQNISRFDFLDSYMNLKKSKCFIFWNGRSTKQGRGFIQTIFFE